jgi:hypothetical protein
MPPDFRQDEYFRTLYNAIPSPVIVVDHDVRIRDANEAGLALLGRKEGLYLKRGGEALHCLNHFATPAGCGHADACGGCIVRNSVARAVKGGKVTRAQARMQLRKPDGLIDVHMLVTAAPFAYGDETLVLLLLEDIGELVVLKSLLPICAWCKKIRDDENYWHTVESYLKRHADVDFSHSICNDCLAKMSSPAPDPGDTP